MDTNHRPGPVADGVRPIEPWLVRPFGVYTREKVHPSEAAMPDSRSKERVLEAVRELPDDATVEDAMERLYLLSKVEEGLRQAEAGETVSAEEARQRILG